MVSLTLTIRNKLVIDKALMIVCCLFLLYIYALLTFYKENHNRSNGFRCDEATRMNLPKIYFEQLF